MIISIFVTCYIAWSFYDCTTTGCESPPENQGKPEATKRALIYAVTECQKSYAIEDCRSLQLGSNTFYMCGFMGFCGWIVEVTTPEDSEFIYRSSVDLEKGLTGGYRVIGFGENDSINTRHVSTIMQKMCMDYAPAKKVGCFDPDFNNSAVIRWKDYDTGPKEVGTAKDYTSPESSYKFNVDIARNGKIMRGYITNYELDVEKVLYEYPVT